MLAHFNNLVECVSKIKGAESKYSSSYRRSNFYNQQSDYNTKIVNVNYNGTHSKFQDIRYLILMRYLVLIRQKDRIADACFYDKTGYCHCVDINYYIDISGKYNICG